MSSLRGAYQGALIGWNAQDFLPSETYGWDSYSARFDRYTLNNDYYNNTAYETAIHAYTALMIFQKKLYRHIRGVRTPAARVVDFFTSKVYPGVLDMETAETGAIPLQAPPKIRNAVLHLWDSSSFGTLKNIYVRNGATLGDAFIKQVNDPVEGCIYQEIIHPSKVTDFKVDKQGLITEATIEYMMRDNVNVINSRTWLYKETIQTDGVQTHFATFKDNQPFAYYTDERGNKISEWDEDYGFIPLVQAQHHNLGLLSGACAFHTATRKIDEINDAASILNDQIRNAVQVAFLMPGTSAPGSRDATTGAAVTFNRDEKTNVPIIHAGEKANAIPLIAQIDINAALKNIESLEAALERELPMLAMYKLWDAQQISGVAVAKLYDPVVAFVKMARANYDTALVLSHQQAIAMGGYHGYPEYRGFNIVDYMNGNLKHTVRDRSVFDDSVEKPAKIMALQTVKDQPSTIADLILQELDYSEDVIKKVIAQIDEQQAQAQADAARAFMTTALGEDGGNGDEQDTTDNTQQPNRGAPETRNSQAAPQP